MNNAVQELVDRAIDLARAEHPGVEYGIGISLANAFNLPKHGDKLYAEVDGRPGHISGYIYRDCLVNAVPAGEGAAPIDFLVFLTPVAGVSSEGDSADHYYIDLRSGTISTAMPDDVAGDGSDHV